MLQTPDKYQRLIVRHLSGEAGDEEELLLQQWIAANEDNLKLFNEFKSSWEIEPTEIPLLQFDKDAAWSAILSQIVEAGELTRPEFVLGTPKKRLFNLYAISAVAATVILLLGIYLLFPGSSNIPMVEYFAEARAEHALVLSDNSEIYPYAGATIIYPEVFSGKQRNIELSGSAFFQVESNPEQPFVIIMEEIAIKVLGTSFSINHDHDENLIEVLVVEGKVLVYTLPPIPHAEIQISGGEKAVFNFVDRTLHKELITNYNFLAWRTGMLEFNHTPLYEVFKALEQTYQLPIFVEANISDAKLTARFVNERIEDIFKTIGILFNLEFTPVEEGYLVK